MRAGKPVPSSHEHKARRIAECASSGLVCFMQGEIYQDFVDFGLAISGEWKFANFLETGTMVALLLTLN